MLKFITILAVAALASCGGGRDDPPAPIAQCNGTPRAAVVYVGPGAPAELAQIPNACVYTTAPDGIAAAVERAKTDAHRSLVYVIGNGTAAPLDFMAAQPGNVDTVSLWFPPNWSGDLHGSLAAIYANGGGCPIATNHYGPTTCADVLRFDAGAAIAQLHLELAQ